MKRYTNIDEPDTMDNMKETTRKPAPASCRRAKFVVNSDSLSLSLSLSLNYRRNLLNLPQKFFSGDKFAQRAALTPAFTLISLKNAGNLCIGVCRLFYSSVGGRHYIREAA
jgi:hypothetical protein